MKILKSTICFSLIIAGMAAIAVAQPPENGSTNVRKIKMSTPQSLPSLRQDRAGMPIPEPIPAPQVAGQAPASNTAEPAVSGNSPCPPAGNCPRPGGLFKNRPKWGCWGWHHDVVPEMPFGASLNAAMKAQVCNGLAAQMVLYQYDFCNMAPCDAHKLNIHGEKRLGELASRMQFCGMHPLVIESTPENPALETARRNYVIKMLRDSDFPIPDEWVVVGNSSVRGMSGSQALGVEKRMHKELIAPDDLKNAQETDSFGASTNGGDYGGGKGPVLTNQ